MTCEEACTLLPLFSRCGYWVRMQPVPGGAEVRLEVRDEAIYGERASFEYLTYALYFLMERGGA